MKIREIVLKELAAPSPAAEPAQNTEPAPQEIKAVQDLIGSIDPKEEQPQSLMNKLTGWIKQYPLLDKITDLIPQTRMVKAIANAVDALEQGDGQTALNSLAGVVGGGVAQAARAVNVGTALAQGDVTGAAFAAGGRAAQAAKGANVATALAQGDAAGAVTALNPTAGRVATAAQQFAQGQTPDELARIKRLAQTKTQDYGA